MPTIEFRGTKAEFRQAVRRLIRILVGKEPDPTGILSGLVLRMGGTLLGKISKDFIVMSQGGTGEMGITWKPLSLVTLLLRRKLTTKAGIEAARGSMRRMDAAAKQQFKLYYRALIGFYRGRSGRKDARHAIAILKRKRNVAKREAGPIGEEQLAKRLKPYDDRIAGLRKILSRGISPEQAKKLALVGATVQILRDNGRLLNSLSPGAILAAGTGPANPDQELRIEPGMLIVGTNVYYAKYHNSNKPRKLKKDGTPKLPRRQFLPDDEKPIPAAWWRAMKATLASGLVQPEVWLRLLGPKARLVA